MEVKYLDLRAQFHRNDKIRCAIQDILDSGQFVLGPAVEKFERHFARLCGTRYAVGVDNGTDALFLALKVLGIGRGDEVITVPNTFLATVGAIVQAGAFPRLVDVADDYNIDPDKIEAAINERTKAIIPVHLTGNPARMDEITDRRIANAAVYDRAFSSPPLSEFITVPPRRDGGRHVYHMYMVLAADRARLLEYLIAAGIEAKVHYPIPMHLQKATLDQDPPFGKTDLSRTEAQCQSLVTLPVHQHLSDDQLDYVVEKVKEFYSGGFLPAGQ